jgi:hypothetical protein
MEKRASTALLLPIFAPPPRGRWRQKDLLGYPITQERQAQRWHWWIYYPTPGNRIREALLKSMDMRLDELDCHGVFWDGMLV